MRHRTKAPAVVEVLSEEIRENRGMTAWTDDAQAIGAVVTALGVVVGAFVAATYAKRANVTVEAECHPDATGLIVAARPVVASVGSYRIHIQSAILTCVEVRREAGELGDGQRWTEDQAFGKTFVVDGGERHGTMTVFDVGAPADVVIGWRISLLVKGRPLIGRGFEWSDRTFVPAPRIPSSHAT